MFMFFCIFLYCRIHNYMYLCTYIMYIHAMSTNLLQNWREHCMQINTIHVLDNYLCECSYKGFATSGRKIYHFPSLTKL